MNAVVVTVIIDDQVMSSADFDFLTWIISFIPPQNLPEIHPPPIVYIPECIEIISNS